MGMKVVITGANGQLGRALIGKAPANLKIIPHTRNNFDLREIGKLERFLREKKPDVVVNTAAYHDTLTCEREPIETFVLNSAIPIIMARIISSWNGIFVFISTDYVFNGKKLKEPYYEDDVPDPLNIYGLTKFAGELGVKITIENFYVIRTSSLFGKTSRTGGNFVLKILEKAKRMKEIRVVNDIFMTPSYTDDVADRIWYIIKDAKPPGVYHISNSGITTWFDFAKEILNQKGLKVKVIPIRYEELGSDLKRPRWSPLDSKKLPPLRHWREALKEYLKEL